MITTQNCRLDVKPVYIRKASGILSKDTRIQRY